MEDYRIEHLAKSWKFFSDHLPLGTRFSNGLSIVTCNLLNKVYYEWILDNSQYLCNSVITDEHRYEIDTKVLDRREKRMMNWIRNRMKQKITIIALQECSECVSDQLYDYAKENFRDMGYKLINSNRSYCSREIIVYDSRKVVVKKIVMKSFGGTGRPRIMVMDFLFKNIQYCLINTHVKFGSHGELDELMFRILKRDRFRRKERRKRGRKMVEVSKKLKVKLICAGDFNVDARVFKEGFRKSHSFVEMTNSEFNHINSNDFEDKKMKIAKFDYVIVSKNLGLKYKTIPSKELEVYEDFELLRKIFYSGRNSEKINKENEKEINEKKQEINEENEKEK